MQFHSLATPRALALCLAAGCLTACASHVQPEPAPAPLDAAAPAPVAAPAKPDAQEPEDEDAVTGASLYARHCAGCHNENGDGKGATMLAQGKEARSFAQGGFAFGNTADAIYGTITSGIPGSSLMPPFRGLMDDEERRMVAEHVLTLTPHADRGRAKGSVMHVGERALFARGKLPPLREGLPERPRGLLVGLPGGASLEYLTDDVRLLAARRGGFADRTDWNDRGGGELRPLGEIVHELEAGVPGPWLFALGASSLDPIALELVATRTHGPDGREAQVESRPKAGTARGLRGVVETLFQPALSEPNSFGRTILLDRAPATSGLVVTVGQWPAANVALRPQVGNPADPASERKEEAWVVLKNGEGFDCIHVANPGRARWGGTDPNHLALLVESTAANPATITIVTIHVKAWDDALLARLSKELSR